VKRVGEASPIAVDNKGKSCLIYTASQSDLIPQKVRRSVQRRAIEQLVEFRFRVGVSIEP
jgi:hypothetical protein